MWGAGRLRNREKGRFKREDVPIVGGGLRGIAKQSKLTPQRHFGTNSALARNRDYCSPSSPPVAVRPSEKRRPYSKSWAKIKALWLNRGPTPPPSPPPTVAPRPPTPTPEPKQVQGQGQPSAESSETQENQADISYSLIDLVVSCNLGVKFHHIPLPYQMGLDFIDEIAEMGAYPDTPYTDIPNPDIPDEEIAQVAEMGAYPDISNPDIPDYYGGEPEWLKEAVEEYLKTAPPKDYLVDVPAPPPVNSLMPAAESGSNRVIGSVDGPPELGIAKSPELMIVKSRKLAIAKSRNRGIVKSRKLIDFKSPELGIAKSKELATVKPQELATVKPQELGIAKSKELATVKSQELATVKPQELGIAKSKELGIAKSQELSIARSRNLGIVRKLGNLKPPELGIVKSQELCTVKSRDLGIAKSRKLDIAKSRKQGIVKSREREQGIAKSRKLCTVKSKELSIVKLQELPIAKLSEFDPQDSPGDERVPEKPLPREPSTPERDETCLPAAITQESPTPPTLEPFEPHTVHRERHDSSEPPILELREPPKLLAIETLLPLPTPGPPTPIESCSSVPVLIPIPPPPPDVATTTKMVPKVKGVVDQKKEAHVCKICRKILSSKANLQNHLIAVHEIRIFPTKIVQNAGGGGVFTKETHVCRSCQKGFKFKLDYVAHTSLATLMKCIFCRSDFACLGTWIHHMLKLHLSRMKNLDCTVCDTKLSTKHNLASHYATHVATHRYECPFCINPLTGKISSYRTPKGITAHLKTHDANLVELYEKSYTTPIPVNYVLQHETVDESRENSITFHQSFELGPD